MRVVNVGGIGAVELPPGWTERVIEKSGGLSLRQLRSFHSADDANIQVRFVYRGHSESDETGVLFQSCLAKPAHTLDSTEINSLSVILGEMAEPTAFQVTSAQTMDVHDRRVLWVEGRWLDSEYWTGTAFFDADGSGRVIQELSCFAGLETYDAARPVFQAILQSIQWTPWQG